MIVEAVLMMDAIVRDGTIGLAALLSTVPKESGDSTPTTPTIYNEVQHLDAALDTFPESDGPFLLISTRTASDTNPLVRPVQDMTVDVVFRYAIRKSSTQDAIKTASYTLRTLRKVLSKAFTTAGGQTLRVRNQVGLYQISSMQSGLMTAPINDTPLSWALTCTCTLRDTWANT